MQPGSTISFTSWRYCLANHADTDTLFDDLLINQADWSKRVETRLSLERVDEILSASGHANRVLKKTSHESRRSDVEKYAKLARDLGRPFIHVFSLADQRGTLFYLQDPPQPKIQVVIPLWIVPHAGAMGLKCSNVDIKEYNRRLSLLSGQRKRLTLGNLIHFASLTLYEPTASSEKRYREDGKNWRVANANSTNLTRAVYTGKEDRTAVGPVVRVYRCGWFACTRTGVKYKYCAGCNRVRYCCQTCQRNAWPSHKLVCRPGLLNKTMILE